MNAIEQYLPLPFTDDRRAEPRHRIRNTISAVVGRGDGTLVDVSAKGARVRHSSPARLGSQLRISFEWAHQRFSATGEVLSSRMIALGEGSTFESRLRFLDLTPESRELLMHFIEALGDEALRDWVANLHGWSHDEHATAAPRRGAFMRCQFRRGRWEKKWTRDASQPEHGFTVPATIDGQELQQLCSTWESSNEKCRAMLREMARASAEG